MRKYDNYNPGTHNGYLPIRTLQHNLIDWFENVTPDFLEEIFYETEFNGLQKGIGYKIERQPITIASEITPQRKIWLYENYNQFLWTVSYSLIVLFEEGIQIPILSGRYNGTVDYDNIHIRRAVATFKEGFNLFKDYNDWVFFDLPNPEKFVEYEKTYIEKANGIFCAAMTFTLLHEFGHQYYGHLEVNPTPEESKKDEFNVDDFAYDKFATKFDTKYATTIKLGVVVALVSLAFFDDTIKGGEQHPDPDQRILAQLQKMNLDEKDNLWGVASLAFRLWSIAYDKPFDFPTEVENYRELFDLTLQRISDYKAGQL
jgi:hypothetical protein